MSKKNFNLENPALQFISEQPKEEVITTAPEGYKINPLYLEKKSRRLQLLIKPSIYNMLKEKATQSGSSVNDLVNNILEEALRGE